MISSILLRNWYQLLYQNMLTNNHFKSITQSSPAVYQIVVNGAVCLDHTPLIGGMQIIVATTSIKTKQSILTGRLSDQAALHGVLNHLYNMRLPVISVEVLGSYQQ